VVIILIVAGAGTVWRKTGNKRMKRKKNGKRKSGEAQKNLSRRKSFCQNACRFITSIFHFDVYIDEAWDKYGSSCSLR
jgi:hypothetical protein